MEPELLIWLGLLAGSLVSGAVLAYYCLRTYDKRGSHYLAVTFVGVVVWTVADILSVFLPAQFLFAGVHLRLLAPDIVVTGILLFAVAYTGRDRLITRPLLGVLALKPLLTQAVLLSPYRESLAAVTPTPAVPGYSFALTPLFGVHAVYAWLLPVIGFILLVQLMLRANRGYQQQLLLVTAAFLTPLGTSVAYHLGPLGVDLTAVSFLVTSTAGMYAVLELRFIDAVPVARNAVFEEMDELVFITDEYGMVTTANRTAEAMFGDGDLAGTAITDLLGETVSVDPDSDADERLDITVTVGDTERSLTVDRSLLTDHRENLLAQLFVCRDITERKRRERELKRQNERLDRFATVVSHDLRNPLNVATMAAELAEDTGDEAAFEKLHGAHDRMERMIDELLTLARTETTIEDTEPLSLADQARDAWRTVDTPGAELDVVVPPDHTIKADPKLLGHVFENLYRNTIDHNDPPLTVTVGTFDDGFYVEDDGQGIPDGDLETVFDHGYTTEADGTGFGLSIVREFVEAHGWGIEATAREGGARFEIRTD